MDKISLKQLFPLSLFCIVVFLLSVLIFFEWSMPERVIIPFFLTSFIAGVTFLILNYFAKDKFVSKIYLISILLHFIFILFWVILKYHIMGLEMPTENNFTPFIVDNDGAMYHKLGVLLSNNFNFEYFNQKLYGGVFPKIVAVIYHIFGANPFIISCMNSIIAGFTAVILYLIGKQHFVDIGQAKLFALLSILNFTHIVNTSTIIRDNYIVLFIYLTIFLSYFVYKQKSLFYLILMCLSLYGLYLFRPYACYIIGFAVVLTWLFVNVKLSYRNNHIGLNKLGLVILGLSPFIICGLFYVFHEITTAMNLESVNDLIAIRETAYVGSNTDYNWNFGAFYKAFFLLPFIVGTICLFFAPFPWEWCFLRRIIYAHSM